MPLPVTSDELDQLGPDASRELTALSLALSRSPKTRKSFLKLWKEVEPEREFPELTGESDVQKVQQSVEERFAQLAKDREEDATRTARERIERDYTDMKARLKVTPEEEKAAEELMGARHIGDFEFAVEHLRMKSAPPAAPVAEGLSGALTMPSLEGLAKDPMGWAPAEAHRAIDEILKSRAA